MQLLVLVGELHGVVSGVAGWLMDDGATVERLRTGRAAARAARLVAHGEYACQHLARVARIDHAVIQHVADGVERI